MAKKQKIDCAGVEKSNSHALVPIGNIENMIFIIKGQKVMVDADLARLYGVSTKRLNEQVKRNIKRFPRDFMFSLSDIEKNELVANCDRFNNLKHSTTLPSAFTEQGIAMLSSVLNSERAILMNIAIMRAFVKLRRMISKNKALEHKLSELEQKIERHDTDIIAIFNAIRQLMKEDEKPKNKIGFV